MPMRPDGQLIIRLALPSVLYAPLYLAKALARTSDIRDRFSIFRHVEFDYAGPPRQPEATVDQLILPVLRARELSINRQAPLIAVGDPTRIASALSADTLDTPYVIGGLITKMCYWLMDARADAGYCDQEEFDEVVVHPRGMTGYSLYRYELSNRALLGSEAISCYPGDEMRVYRARTFCERDYERAFARFAHIKGSRTPRRLASAFLTTDPGVAMRTHYGRRWRVIRAYSRDTRPVFQRVLMTGLITGQELYANRHRQSQIDAIVNAIAEAITLISSDEFLAASCLLSYADQRIDFAELYDVDQLALHLEELVATGSYNLHPQLKVTDAHINNAVEIRRAADISKEAQNLDKFRFAAATYAEVQTCSDRVARVAGEIIERLQGRRDERPGAASSFLRRVFADESGERKRLRTWRLLSIVAIVTITLIGAFGGAIQAKLFAGPLGVSIILLFASTLALGDYLFFIGEQRSRRGHSGVLTSIALSAALSAGVYHGVETVSKLWHKPDPKSALLTYWEALRTLAHTPWLTILVPFACALIVAIQRELKPVARERLGWTIQENLRLTVLTLRLCGRRMLRVSHAVRLQVASIVGMVFFGSQRMARGILTRKPRPVHQ